MTEATVSEIASIERDRLAALVSRDIDRAARIHADDFELVSPSGRVLSKARYLDAVRSGDIAYAAWEPGAIDVRVHGDVAVLRYPAEIAFIVDGAPTVPRRYRHMDLYERREGRWQVVWSQATRIED